MTHSTFATNQPTNELTTIPVIIFDMLLQFFRHLLQMKESSVVLFVVVALFIGYDGR